MKIQETVDNRQFVMNEESTLQYRMNMVIYASVRFTHVV